MKKNNFKHFQSVARCESYNASFLPAARGKRACNLELVSCRFRQRCYAVPARSGWAASSFRIMGVWRFESLGARWRAIWSLFLVKKATLGIGSSVGLGRVVCRSMGVWHFEACFLRHVPENNVGQGQPPFLRRGKCFLELVAFWS